VVDGRPFEACPEQLLMQIETPLVEAKEFMVCFVRPVLVLDIAWH
jgi:hypothetical protein